MAPRPLPPLSYLRECFRYEADVGRLRWLVRPRTHFPDSRAWRACNARYVGKLAGGFNDRGYRLVGIDGQLYRASRLIWLLHYETEPPLEIDHWNLNRADDRIQNLRAATHLQNCFNRRIKNSNATGFKGICARYGRFQARILVNGKRVNLGTFDTAEEAHAAYCDAARRLHGVFWNPG